MDDELDYNEILRDLGVLLPIMNDAEEKLSKEAIALIFQEKGYLIVRGDKIYLNWPGVILVTYNKEFQNLCKYLGISVEIG